ncbi:type VII secretion protein EssC [Paenibacillus alginolyticus]|uniref:Type VII secretion protein EssC n=1 Tax=Paenibacillus alginolyticus TaxID=59839 RepID=A0ABT4G7B0_9BACL|nr:type VII secretion protein EssC [Paenibacillus alginolyticus]MCY9692060.1 type VII secretion protein EssC [Paenibacillus alginolyticus]MEC0144250.1 type VII secretion protein EssC [Paenibacillus alginolyticus]
MQLQLSLLKEKVIYSTALPEKQKGQYWVTQLDINGNEERVISVEGMDGQWVLKSNKNAYILEKGTHRVKELVLAPMSIYNIMLRKTNENVVLFSEPVTDDRKSFKKLMLPCDGKFTIGRVAGCDIQYANSYTSSQHAEMTVEEGVIKIRDCNSSNGTFVNGLRVTESKLQPGDVVFIIGLKIIVGSGFISLNNPDDQVTYNQALFKPFVKHHGVVAEEEEEVEEEKGRHRLFYRSPRFKREIEKVEIRVDPPPSIGNMEQIPLMLMLGPSLTMGLASAFSGVYILQNVISAKGNLSTAMPMLVMSGSMLLGTILWPILTRRFESKRRAKREQLRQNKYKEYLDKIRNEITHIREHQSLILHENHITLEDCVSRIKLRKRNLWERTHGQNDFLKFRLGLGSIPMYADFKFPENRFSVEDDVLQEELYRLVVEPKMLENVPISLSLTDDWISGIIGPREEVIHFVKGIILQLVALHSYDELRLVFLYDKREQAFWEFIKWLPHVWNAERSVRFIATNASELKELTAYLDKEIIGRQTVTSEEARKDITPYYVVVATDKHLASKTEMLNTLLKQKKNIGFSVLHLYNELKDLPKECSIVVEYDGISSKIYDQNDISGTHIAFKPDVLTIENEMDMAVSLSNTQLDSSVTAYALPNMLTFLDLFGVSKIEHLNALTRWQDNDPTLSLETPIGIDTSGEPFFLDLHEKFHGPHGLIAGMTGSGKSEFIMTFILSLAINYHPHEVAFILIDYKGGGMANTFSNLPHLAGTITNLDGAAVKRSLISIQSELKRRQFIFSETSKMLSISNIDIYKYQKLYREGQVSEPLQHLFIISDEFAELKTQQPEFMNQLVSAARIGRSLGVHLILATQKPSGVVDDQIWSNSRFRICLKVQERADSMDVIKKPDAAELSVTGRFFVQVGFNELFELGQSAWGGAPYLPTDRIEKKQDDSIVVIDNLGRVVKQIRADKRRQVIQNPPKQIDEVNKYLAAIAKEEHIQIRPLWQEPIPELIYLDQLHKKYKVASSRNGELNPVIGEVDDPANQNQYPLHFPLTQEGNAVIYGVAGSGKTTFLTTLIFSLMENHTPSEINIYILDFGSETLRAFSKAPHVGDILLSHETEKINNLFKMLNKEMEVRKKLFADYGGDYLSYIRSGHAELEAVVVFIHNFSAFTEIFSEKEETLSYLTREGLKYGIYFILTAINTGAVRYRLLQNFKQLFVLQLNDNADYSTVLGSVDGVFPSKIKARGIYKTDCVYEFQTAHIATDVNQTFEYLRNYCDDYAARWMKAPAKRIPVLPDKVDLDYLEHELNRFKAGTLPVGVEKNNLELASYNFSNAYIQLILSQSVENAYFTQGIAEIAAAKNEGEILVLDAKKSFQSDESKPYKYAASKSELEQAVIELFQILVERNNTYKDALEQGKSLPEFEKLTCMIQSFSGLSSQISEDAKDKLKVLLEKGNAAYNVHFIVNDSAAFISSISYENWFKENVSLNEGIWIGNGIAEQYQFKIGKTTTEMYQNIGEDFGYILHKGNTTLVKLVSSIHARSEDEVRE